MSEKYYEKIPENDKLKWINTFGRSINDSVNNTLVSYFGKPLVKLIEFLKYEYRSHCVPSNISSGLANLPLKYIYVNGTRSDNQTTQSLPFGEKLNGTKSYEAILYYFTTSEELTPDKIHELGKKKLQELYAEAEKAAESVTSKSGDNAVYSFKKILNNQSSFFNDEPFPANESDEFAFTQCKSLAKAKIFCPKRYDAFQKWSAFVRGKDKSLFFCRARRIL